MVSSLRTWQTVTVAMFVILLVTMTTVQGDEEEDPVPVYDRGQELHLEKRSANLCHNSGPLGCLETDNYDTSVPGFMNAAMDPPEVSPS
ncbi:hypothetical protein ElyMa_001371300 [Elysia marginata]|uniref:Uncharacterized protein n=1 Tax=Elysia marginata TaxID=1093978 RepID=A0AAV4IS09_9GAST|nr:hypothetical protein ElyMa_001371300 [Elysia marginata]